MPAQVVVQLDEQQPIIIGHTQLLHDDSMHAP
jgi:hypothetical protein